MSNSALRTILTHVVATDWPFTKLMILQMEGRNARVVAFYDKNVPAYEDDPGWYELVLSNFNTGLPMDKRILSMPTTATEQQIASELGYTLENSKIHFLITKEEVQGFLEDITINTDDDPHRSYFEVLNELVTAHTAAVNEHHEFLERVGSGTATLFDKDGNDSDEYRRHHHALTMSYSAMRAAMSSIAEVHFKETK